MTSYRPRKIRRQTDNEDVPCARSRVSSSSAASSCGGPSCPTSRCTSPATSVTSESDVDEITPTKPRVSRPTMGRAYVEITRRPGLPPRTYSSPSMGKPYISVPSLKFLEATRQKQRVLSTRSCPVAWCRVAGGLSREEVEQRIRIREFIVRYQWQIFLQPKHWNKMLIELFDRITGNGSDVGSDWDTDWISIESLRQLLEYMITALATNEDHIPDRIIFMDAAEKLLEIEKTPTRTCASMWDILATMEGELSKPLELTKPDAMDTPDTIQCTAQFVPVVTSLIKVLSKTKEIRAAISRASQQQEEILESARNAKQRVKEAHNKASAQSAKKMQLLKNELDDIENAKTLLLQGIKNELRPLGTDTTGRVYWALSPGIAEREHAQHILGIYSLPRGQKQEKERRKLWEGGIRSERKRSQMDQWSWFVVVWGSALPSHSSRNRPSGNLSWYGFWSSDDIRQLADWVEADPQNPHGSSSSASICAEHSSSEDLKQNLADYADLLKWRASRSKTILLPLNPPGLHDSTTKPTSSKGEGKEVGSRPQSSAAPLKKSTTSRKSKEREVILPPRPVARTQPSGRRARN